MNPIDRAARTVRAGQETAEASAQVIARRLTIMGEAMANPLRADHAELSRMGAEKVEAMTASAGAAYTDARDLAERAGLSGPQVGEAVRKARVAAIGAARTLRR